MSKKLVLFGEGAGEVQSLPILAKRLLGDKNGWDVLHMDKAPPLRVGNVHRLAKNGFAEWKKSLGNALKRRDVGAMLVVLDGDADWFPTSLKRPFCAMTTAIEFAKVAREQVGAGQGFSLAMVFACMEYESWLIAGVQSLVGQKMEDGRWAIKNAVDILPNDPESAPRDAKGWLSDHMEMGYSPTRDQALLTKLVDLSVVRDRRLKSFQRLERAIEELINANRTGSHVCTPTSPTSQS
ncbi:MAG: DUF4276 family protein [Phycisphaerales bacterium]